MRRRAAIMAVLALGLPGLGSGEGQAAENTAGFYALGTKTAMAGYVPPPGTYFIDVNYYYQGTASGTAALGVALRDFGIKNVSGNLLVDADFKADGRAYYNLASALWVTPRKVLGGNLGFALILPVGTKDTGLDVDALATLTLGPPINRTFQQGAQFSRTGGDTNIGDPIVSSVIGWHQGNWHWSFVTYINVPLAPYDKNTSANIGFNHWTLDTTAGVTWLDPKTGFEISAAPGFTFNWENPDTNYTTGTEFHVEFAVLEHFTKKFAVGIAGFHYVQLTGDSGSGAVLGDFKGRATALGPIVTYDFAIGKTPVKLQGMWLQEFGVEHRLEGDYGLLTVSLPLSRPGR